MGPHLHLVPVSNFLHLHQRVKFLRYGDAKKRKEKKKKVLYVNKRMKFISLQVL